MLGCPDERIMPKKQKGQRWMKLVKGKSDVKNPRRFIQGKKTRTTGHKKRPKLIVKVKGDQPSEITVVKFKIDKGMSNVRKVIVTLKGNGEPVSTNQNRAMIFSCEVLDKIWCLGTFTLSHMSYNRRALWYTVIR